MIETARLQLVPATAQTIRWEMDNHAALSDALGAVVPASWPPQGFRDALEFFARAAEENANAPHWGIHYWLSHDVTPTVRTLVGSGGFFGPPDAEGAVEIGYGMLEIFQGQGYATEALAALTQWAHLQPRVVSVVAHADVDNRASLRVLQKCRFTDAGPGQETGTRRFVYVGADAR